MSYGGAGKGGAAFVGHRSVPVNSGGLMAALVACRDRAIMARGPGDLAVRLRPGRDE